MTLSDRLILRNALLGRYAYAQLRPMVCAISIGIYLCVVVLAFILAYAACYSQQHLVTHDFWHGLFITFAILQALLLWIIGMNQAGTALQQEINEKSMDFFRLLPLSALEKIIGILAGRNILVLGLGLLNTILVAVCGLQAGVGLRLLLEHLVFTWVGGVSAMLLTLLLSTYERRGRTTPNAALAILLAIFFLPPAIAMAANWSDAFPHGAYVRFFGWQARLFVFLTFLALYVGAWSVAGLMRRFNHDRAPLFTPAGTFWSTLGVYAIAAGLLWNYLLDDPGSALLVLWVATAFVMLFMVLGAYRGWDDYLETMARTGAKPGLDAANLSNLALGALMVLAWCAFGVITDLCTEMAASPHTIVVFATFWFVFLALMEMSTTHAPLTPRVHVLTGFLAILYLILPLILASVLGWDDVMVFSPIGYLVHLSAEPQHSELPGMAPAVLNAAVFSVLWMIIARRYRAVAGGAAQM